MQAKPAGAACAKCPARDGKLLLPSPTATGRAALAIVDDAPSSLNFKEGAHVSGPAARMLARGFAANDLPPPAAWHRTSAVLCACSLKEQAKAAKCCGERLRAELAATGAPLIVPLGGIALQQVMASKAKLPIMKHRGFVHQRSDGAVVLPIMHPWRATQLPKWLPILERDVARIGRVANDGFRLPEDCNNHETIYATTPELLTRGLAQLEKRNEVIADVETVGLGPTSTSLVCLGLGNLRTSVVIPWSRGQNGIEPFWLNVDAVARDVTKLLRDRVTVTHNGPAFDHIVMARYGCHIGPKWDDTLLMTHALRGHLPKGLAFLVSLYADSNAWKADDHAGCIEDLWRYNAQDLVRTSIVYEALRQEIGDGPMMRKEAA